MLTLHCEGSELLRAPQHPLSSGKQRFKVDIICSDGWEVQDTSLHVVMRENNN